MKDARGAVLVLAVVTAVAAVAVQVVEGPPGSGYGWGSVVVSSLLLAVPLVGLGLLVRAGGPQQGPQHARVTLALAVFLVVVVLLALVGNWSGQSSTDRALDTVVALLVTALAALAIRVEWPDLRRPGSG